MGVGYPMATAILDILDPDVWPVIDQWAVQTVSEPSRTALYGPLGSGSAPQPTRRTLGIWQLKVKTLGSGLHPSARCRSYEGIHARRNAALMDGRPLPTTPSVTAPSGCKLPAPSCSRPNGAA